MPTSWETIWSGREPCLGVYDKRDPRYIDPRFLAVGKNIYYDGLNLRRRKGYKKLCHTSLLHGTYSFDGLTQYGAIPYDTDLDLGTDWTVEVVFLCPLDTMRPQQETILSLFNTSNRAFHLYKDSSNVLQFRADTAGETFSASGGALSGKTKYTVSIRRVGLDVFIYLNGSQVGTDAITVDVDNKVAASQLLIGALANTASGNLADSEFSCLKVAEVRWWNVARSPTQIDDNHARELLDGDDTGLVHNWLLQPHGNKKFIRDSRRMISVSTLRDGITKPCRRILVDRHWPESCTAWGSTNPGIREGRRWSYYDGHELYDKQTDPAVAAEDVFSQTQGGIHQWMFAHEFIVRQLPASGSKTLLDWRADATDPHLRLEVDFNGYLTATSRWGGVNRTATNTVAITGGCQAIQVYIGRNDQDFILRTDRIDTGANIDDKTTATGSSAAGEAVAGRAVTRGAMEDGTQVTYGAGGELIEFREYTGPRITQGAVPAGRLKDAIMHVSTLTRGSNIEDRFSGRDLTASCLPVDEDDDDGATPDDYINGYVPTARGHGVGIYDWQSRAPQGGRDRVREIIIDFAGALYRSKNLAGVECDWERIYAGRSAGRTHLTSWARFRDQLAIFNGIDKNLVYDGEKITKLGIEAPATTSTATDAVSAGNLLAGKTYTYVAVFYDPFTDHESNPGAEFTVTIGAIDSKADLTSLPLSTDPDRPWLWRRIYRTKNDDIAESEIFYRVATIENNTETTLSGENTADTALSPILRLERDEFGFYVNGVMPICTFGVIFQAKLWAAGDPEDQTAIHFTRTGDIEAHPATYTLRLSDYGTGDPITGIAATYDRIFAFTERSIWEIVAEGSLFTITQRPIVPNIGAAGHWGIQVIDGVIYFLNPGDQRVYRFDGQGQPQDVSDPIDGTFFTMNQRVMPFSSSAYMRKRDTLLFTVSTGSVNDTAEEDEGYPENDVILALNLRTRAWSPWDADVNVLGVVEDPLTEENQVLALDYAGFLRQYDQNENDGYDQAGDKKGEISSGSTPTIVNCLQETGAAPADFPSTEDGLAGLYFRIVHDGVEYKSRILANDATLTIYLKDALPFSPEAGEEWWIGGIDYDIESAAFDFEYACHLKALLGGTVHLAPQTGNDQDQVARLHVYAYQDDTTSTRTSVPAMQEHDQVLTEPDTKNSLWRFEVRESAIFHTLRFRAKYPDEPCTIESLTLEYKPTRVTAIAT